MGAETVVLITNILNGFVSLMRAGVNLKAVVNEVRKLEEAGATPEQVSEYIKELRNKALDALKEDIA